jgi:DNA-binding MarR family transcriptional regulator
MARVQRRVQRKDDLAAEAWRPLARFFFETASHRSEIFRAHGLTPNDAKALWALDPVQGKTMRALADRWFCDASNATWMVDRLEERGLAERRADPNDRRVKLVVLTLRGMEERRRLMDLLFEPPPELLKLDRSDLESLRDALARLPTSEG